MSAVALPAGGSGRSPGAKVPYAIGLGACRLLRLELRRSTMMWMIPLALFVFWLDTYRSSMALAPLWSSRTLIVRQGSTLDDFAPFVMGAAAWAGGRDRRRTIGEQVNITALPRWAGRSASWAATAAWALGAYLAGVGFLYAAIAWQGAAGAPAWWPVIVGAVGLVAISAVGFALGMLLPSRFTAPLTAIAVALLLRQTLRSGGRYVLLSPMASPASSLAPPKADDGIFYPYLPDLSLTQLLFLTGLTVAALGVLGVQAVCGGTAARRAAAAAVAVGLASSGSAIALISTARVEAAGVVIPALHDPRDDHPRAYTPVCSATALPVCLNPVYKAYLPTLTAALDPMLRELAGLPGAPSRFDQVALDGHQPSATVSGNPPVAQLALNIGYEGAMLSGPGPAPGTPIRERCCTSQQLWSSVPLVTSQVLPPVAAAVVDSLVGHTTAAQQAVSEGLLTAIGVSVDAVTPMDTGSGTLTALPKPGTAAYAAVRRFAALPGADRHAWLATHLAELRAGSVTLEQLP